MSQSENSYIETLVAKEVFVNGNHMRIDRLENGAWRMVLNRPAVKNAFNAEMISEISDGLKKLLTLHPDDLRLLILSGEGPVFCAGADLNYMRQQASADLSDNIKDARMLGQMFFRLASFPVPVLAEIQGAAVGGGFGLAVCADVVLARPQTQFATSEVKLGLVPGVISPYVMRKLNLGHASYMMLSGGKILADEALRYGIVNRIAPVEAGVLKEMVDELLQAGPQSARRTKELIRHASPLPPPETFEYTVRAIADARVAPEAQAGLAAFFDKKSPAWKPESRAKE